MLVLISCVARLAIKGTVQGVNHHIHGVVFGAADDKCGCREKGPRLEHAFTEPSYVFVELVDHGLLRIVAERDEALCRVPREIPSAPQSRGRHRAAASKATCQQRVGACPSRCWSYAAK